MLFRNVSPKSLYVFVLAFLLVFINQRIAPLTVKAQNTLWSIPQTIPGYDPETVPPILIADQNRTIHAFSSQWVDIDGGESFRAIVYNQWTLDQGWTTPTDIILSPTKEARLTDAHLDSKGIFHVLFFGGDGTGGNIYYSKAPLTLADDAKAWSVPLVIGENAGDPEGAVFVEDDQGTMYVIYNGRQFGNGLYIIISKDSGEKWSSPNPIFFAKNDEPNIGRLEVIDGESGWLHAIWNVYNILGQGRGIYYSRSEDGNIWSEPALLADAQDGLGTHVPTIFEYNNTLFALYISQVPANKIIMQRSTDNGKTWSPDSIVFPRHVGINGSLSVVTDSNSDLHLFFGQRISGSPDIHGMWHSQWKNNRWTEPDAVIKRPLIVDTDGYNGFDPYEARAVVSQGNTILVTWRTDYQSKGNGVWFAYKTLDTPELPVTPWLATELKNTAQGTPTMRLEDSITPAIKLTQPATLEFEGFSAISTSNPSMPLLIGIIPIVILLILLIIRKNIGKN